MQNAATKSRAAPTTKQADLDLSLKHSPVRWSTHTLAADPHDTIRSRADSTTSTCVDTFAHRRRNRVSDLTFVDLLDDAPQTLLARSESHASSLNDLSATLNNDEDEQMADLSDLTKFKAVLTDANHIDALHTPHSCTDPQHHNDNDDDFDDDDDVMTQRIDRLMAATMEALEASNRLVLDTLSSRAKLAQLNAMEAALDSHLDAREAHLRRQIQAVTDMTDFVSKTSAELQKLTSPASGMRHPSVGASTSQLTTLADPAEVHVRDAAATGIVQALDRDATIGKTAAKRLERMLQTPSPTASPPSAVAAQRRNNSSSSRRAFSISNFSSVQSSIAEETTPQKAATSNAISGSRRPSSELAAITPSSSSTTTPQKKRSVSHDTRASGAMKLMTKLGAPTMASTSGPVSSLTVSNGPALVAGTTIAAERSRVDATDSDGSRQPPMRPSLMATLRPDVSSAPSEPTLLSKATVREDNAMRPPTRRSAPGQPSYATSSTSKSSAAVGVASTVAESTLAALLGMPSAVASTSSRTETPSDSSYFDSAMEDSISSASPPTPGSMHAIHDVLSTPWKPGSDNQDHDSNDLPSQQQRSARRASVYSNLVSPTASLSLSLSDRDRAHQLSSQLSELRAERVMWNANSIRPDESGTASGSTSGAGAGGGGALRALQKLNERSAAKIAGHSGASADEGGSKRASLGLGLPSFSALRPSASRSVSTSTASAPTSTATPYSAAKEPSAPAPVPSADTLKAAVDGPASAADTRPAAEVSSSSLSGGGWRSWASWSAPAAVANEEATTTQK
ncbi:hypothetical protein PHSY_002154 [Pseudozyma hubeiensis SY62]|uniref:Uncharacterized protein n=1 Tax=Pseudozyma hubeiensis (strain SY62) TaxID=1305764 RepID=R9P0C3_PSEHS|nr:hypothetical protein PHSY_002154 [Pseudozyma hubeiensis SY62]GAC94581.1 hypothetical protein PHSY_002154 [Pseudozyma hubeiensis SY62]